MAYFKIVYENGSENIVTAKNSLEVVKRFDLATKENIGTKLIQLTEWEASMIARFLAA